MTVQSTPAHLRERLGTVHRVTHHELVSWAWYDIRTMSPDAPTEFFGETPRPRLSNYFGPGQLVSPDQAIDLRTIQLCPVGTFPPIVGTMALVLEDKPRWEGPTILSWNRPQEIVLPDDAIILAEADSWPRPHLRVRIEPDGESRHLAVILAGYKRRPVQ